MPDAPREYEIVTSYELPRGCGYRSPGASGIGIYLMGGGLREPCELIPIPLTVCPTCGGGIHFSRGFTWIDPTKLFAAYPCTGEDGAASAAHGRAHRHAICPACTPSITRGQAGLIWVGERFYPNPADFVREALQMGISRKLPALPHGFEVGATWVFFAHINAIPYLNEDGDEARQAGIFYAYKPQRVDIVVDIAVDDPDALPDNAKRLKDRLGDCARIVRVVPVDPAADVERAIMDEGDAE